MGRVLVVDDEPGVRCSLRAILEPSHTVLTAASGPEAIDLLSRESADVVTLDLKMPGLCGLPLLDRLKAIDRHLEVIIVTGYGSHETVADGFQKGAFDHIAKPFDDTEVCSVVDAALIRRDAVSRMQAGAEVVQALLPPADDAGGRAHREAMLRYVEPLLYLRDLRRGLMPLAVGPVDVCQVCRDVRTQLAAMAHTHGMWLHVEAPPSLVVRTDAARVTRLVHAVIENAIRYAPVGGITARLTPTPDGGLCLQVLHAGLGMDAGLVDRDDDMAAAARQAPPRLLGLGLRFAEQVARTLGGLAVAHTTRDGTIVQIVLPPLDAAA